MKHILPFVLSLALCASVIHAQTGGVPSTMNYQGYLTDITGAPVADGDYALHFALYPTEFGGAPLWEETHSTVQVNSGLFTVVLGTGNPAHPIMLPFDQEYYLGVAVGSDDELSPRVRLTTTPYSYRARTAGHADLADLAGSVPDGSITGAALANGAVTTPKIASGAVGGAQVAANSITTDHVVDNSLTAADLGVNVLSSLDGVTADGGNIDLVAGPGVTITSSDAANTITLSSDWDLPVNKAGSHSSYSFTIENTGTGGAGYFRSTSTGNTMSVYNSSTGNGIYAFGGGGSSTFTGPTAAVKASAVSSGEYAFVGGYGAGYPILNWYPNFTVKGSGETWIDGPVGIKTTPSSSYSLYVNGNAAKNSGTAWINTSDRRLKDIDGPFEKGLREVLQLRTVRFHYRKDNPLGLPSATPQIGLIAQEVSPVYPECVSVDQEGYLNLDMHAINISLINAVQDLHALLEKKRARSDDLQAQIDALQHAVTRLAKRVDAREDAPQVRHASR